MSGWLSDSTLAHLQAVVEEPDAAAGRYELLEEIGRGGMGTVYRARDRELGREVALKVERLPGPAARERSRLLREARVLARLEHPGIVPVHDAGTLADGRLYYAMKLVRGRSLAEHAAGKPLAELLRLFERVCEAVGFAHAPGVVHRDLKPANVMVGPFGEVLVVDWGVAKLRAAAAASASAADAEGGAPAGSDPGPPAAPAEAGTVQGTVLGTPGYMPPEQARGEVDRVDERADVFALGVLLRFLVEGAAPGALPRPLLAVVARATAADPAARYPGVEELAADLAAYRAGAPVGAYRENALERLGRIARPYRAAILLVAAYLLMRILLLVLAGR